MRVAGLLGLLVALAGCLNAPAPADPPVSDMIATTLTYDDCEELLGVFPVREDAIALPEGFAAAPLAGQGPGAVFIVGWSCTSAHAGETADVQPFTEAFVAFSVTPPETLRLEGAFAHAILLGGVTSSPLAAQTYHAWTSIWRLDRRDGPARIRLLPRPASGRGTHERRPGVLPFDR